MAVRDTAMTWATGGITAGEADRTEMMGGMASSQEITDGIEITIVTTVGNTIRIRINSNSVTSSL